MMDNPFADLIPQTQANANPFADLIPSNSMKTDPSLEESIPKSALIGIGSGLTQAYQGAKQLGMTAGESLGLIPKGSTDTYTKDVDAENSIYQNTPVANSTSGKVGNFVGQSLPYMVVPGGVSGGLAKRALTGALSGAGIGAAQFVPEGNSRGFNALIGAATGGLLPPLLGLGAKGVNAIRGEFSNPTAKAVTNLGAKYKVPVFASDADPTAAKNAIAQGLEEIPLVGMRGAREEQMKSAQSAAQNLVSDYQDKMLTSDFGGKTGLKKIEQVAKGGSIRAKAAQGLLDNINNSGDDWNKIIETSGDLKLFRAKLIADRKYNKVEELANQFGGVGKKETVSAIDKAITDLGDNVLPDNALLNQLNTIKENIISKDLNYSQMRKARSRIGDLIDGFYKGSNSLIGKEGVGSLQMIKDAIGKDMDNFAQTNGQSLKTVWKNADHYYQNVVAPFKDSKLARTLGNADTDEIYGKFITRGNLEGRAQRFYNSLDDKGKSAVKYGMVNDALEKATSKEGNMFSPAIFDSEMKRKAGAQNVFFRGEDKAEITGFTKLMRHVDRAPAAISKPETGVKSLPYLIGGALVGGGLTMPGTTAAAGVSAYGLKLLMTTRAGRNYLLAASKIKVGSPAMQKVIDNASQYIQRGITANSVNTINSQGNGDATQ
jgi:hypothetical protein